MIAFPFWNLFARIKEIETNKYIVMDAGYKTPAIARSGNQC